MADLPGPTSCISKSSCGLEQCHTTHVFQRAEGKEEVQERFTSWWGESLPPGTGALPSCLKGPSLRSWQLALLSLLTGTCLVLSKHHRPLPAGGRVLWHWWHWCCEPCRSTAHNTVWQLKGLVINSEVPSNILVTNSNLHFYFIINKEKHFIPDSRWRLACPRIKQEKTLKVHILVFPWRSGSHWCSLTFSFFIIKSSLYFTVHSKSWPPQNPKTQKEQYLSLHQLPDTAKKRSSICCKGFFHHGHTVNFPKPKIRCCFQTAKESGGSSKQPILSPSG